MPRTHRNPEQQLALLREQEQKLKDRRKEVEEKLRRQREREAAEHLANLVQVLKRYGLSKLTPERLKQALASLSEVRTGGEKIDMSVARPLVNQPAAPSSTIRVR